MSSIPPSSRALPLAAAVLTLLLHPAHADFTNVIAHEAAATQASSSWFTGLPTWHVDTSAVPASPAVPADSPARDMVFGAPLAFAVFPVNPTSSFAVDLTFLDDGGDRVQSLTVGGVAVAPRVALPPKAILAARFNISSAAVQPVPGFPGALGLTFSLSALAGPNAILSSFVLYSSNTSDPPVAPPVLPTPTHALPRLTPRPLSVAGADVTAMDLMGTWDFDAAPSPRLLGALRSGSRSEAVAALSANAGAWAPIAVPGEYTLQGWRVPAFQPVVYRTSFTPPASWAAAGLRTKLRCDGIYSDATVYVNGGLAGGHLGGFTPFEVDVSSLLAAGGASNNLTIVVVGMSLADTLASGSQYAAHDLGGITRKLYLVAVPDVSLADVHAVTSFPAGDYTRATLWLNISVANDGSATTTSAVAVAAELTFTGREEASGQVCECCPPDHCRPDPQ